MSNGQQYYRQKLREPLEIKNVKQKKRRKVLNRNKENLVKTDTWTPLFAKLTAKKNQQKDLTSSLEMVLIACCVSFTFENRLD